MECKKHKTYMGKRAPKDCPDCWKIYFETDTAVKKKKYPEEYAQYCEPPKKEESIKKEPEPNTPKKEKTGEITIQVPVRLSKYFWSETLQTSVKITGYIAHSDMVLMHVDLVKVVPRSEIANLKLFPYSAEGMTLRTQKRVLTENTMTIYIDKNNQDVIKSKTPSECEQESNCLTWDPDQKLPVEEDGPRHILQTDETGEYIDDGPIISSKKSKKTPKKDSKTSSTKKRGRPKKQGD